jgi:hypothetical protein
VGEDPSHPLGVLAQEADRAADGQLAGGAQRDNLPHAHRLPVGAAPAQVRPQEYLKALDLYRNGKGYHGFAGHLLTIGHALIELRRAGYQEMANKGVEAYWRFVRQARDGADLGGQKVEDAPPRSPTPRERDYWLGQGKRPAGEIVSSHLIKCPCSFFAIAKDVRDDDLKRRILEKIYYLTAVS